jgi:peptidoglycan hydrolase-like protein with peptidoglycan-binding domain
MNIRKTMPTLLALALAACAQQTPKPVAPPPAPVAAEAPPAPLTAPAPPSPDAAAIAAAQRNLRALGYAAGKSADVTDAGLHRAILAFEKDQGLTEDGELTPALEERLKQLRTALVRKSAAQASRSAIFVYSDGTIRNTGLSVLPPVPDGLVSDAPADLARTMRPGSQLSYHLGHRTADSFATVNTVTCHVGRIAQTNTAFGTADILPVDCRMEGGDAKEWHSLYSPPLDAVMQQDSAGKSRVLIAIRPATANWPSAARTGLDWAITHALETPASDTPVPWSSTGVAQHFDIRAFGKVSGQEIGLGGKWAAASCRRFELTEDGRPPSHYPGIACQKDNGAWTLAGTAIALASPAKTIGMRAPSPDIRSAQNR